MLKVVADTNIYISAVLVGKRCEKVLDLAKEGKIQILLSETILEELSRVLRTKFRWNNWQISVLIKHIRSFTYLITPTERITFVKDDPSDNKILECAVEAKADYIVTGDWKHLLTLKEYQSIKILPPSELLSIVEEEK